MTSEEIKQNVSMRDVLERYGVKVNRNGMCCCPIHGEKHPSMKVYPDGYKCFACNSAGDIFSFVMAYENCDFPTAFRTLGGTYQKQANKYAAVAQKSKFGRIRAQKDREEKAEKDFRKMIDDAIGICIDMVNQNEPFSDDWCYGITKRQYLEHIFEEYYINEDKGVKKADVIRMCQGIRRRANPM